MWISVAFFVFGLIVGSFLNAVFWRIREDMTLGGRSMCPECRAKISWYDNIPLLSFFLLGGRCRACRGVISWRYPIIEGATGTLFLFSGSAFFIPLSVESWILTAFYLVSLSILLLIFLFDLETMEIPNILLWVGVGSSIIFLFALDWWSFDPGVSIWSLRLHSGIFGGIVGFLPLFLIATLSRERWMGMGDGFLAFLLGLMVGWPEIIFTLFLGFGIGAFVGVVLILSGRRKLQSEIPLGPFLIAGATITLFLGERFPDISSFFFLFSTY